MVAPQGAQEFLPKVRGFDFHAHGGGGLFNSNSKFSSCTTAAAAVIATCRFNFVQASTPPMICAAVAGRQTSSKNEYSIVLLVYALYTTAYDMTHIFIFSVDRRTQSIAAKQQWGEGGGEERQGVNVLQLSA